MVKILSIGNSFSQNCTTMLEKLNSDLYVRNLCLGGCSLEMHSNNIKNDYKAYEFQENGVKLFDEIISVLDGLKMEDWDYVTIQQVSQLAGIYDSYYPYITDLIDYIKDNKPKAKIIFNQTWAYEAYSDHPCFSFYDNDNKKMYNEIVKTTHKIVEELNLPMIKTGEFIELLRSDKKFYREDKTCVLSHDGFHLSIDYGNFAAAYIWNWYFTKALSDYVPECVDLKTIELIKQYFKVFIKE